MPAAQIRKTMHWSDVVSEVAQEGTNREDCSTGTAEEKPQDSTDDEDEEEMDYDKLRTQLRSLQSGLGVTSKLAAEVRAGLEDLTEIVDKMYGNESKESSYLDS